MEAEEVITSQETTAADIFVDVGVEEGLRSPLQGISA